MAIVMVKVIVTVVVIGIVMVEMTAMVTVV
jgi:hypothetical protein